MIKLFLFALPMTDFYETTYKMKCRSISRFSFDCLPRNNMKSEAIEVDVGEACFPFYTTFLFLISVLFFMITATRIFALVKKKYAT